MLIIIIRLMRTAFSFITQFGFLGKTMQKRSEKTLTSVRNQTQRLHQDLCLYSW